MKKLLRTRVDRFDIKGSLRLSQIEEKMAAGRIGDCLIPVDSIFEQYLEVRMKEEGDRFVYNGNSFTEGLTCRGKKTETAKGDPVRVYDSKGGFVGLYRYERGMFRPVKMFL